MCSIAQPEIGFQPAITKAWTPAFPGIEEPHRRLIVRLVSAVYWLLIFEGVLRKWIFPQWGRELFFLRDPFVILVYILVFARRTRLPRSGLKEIGFAFSVAGLGLAFLCGVSDRRIPAYILVYGLRNYFLYMPLAFVIARYFNLWDLAQLARKTLMVCIPMALLVLVQLGAPANSPINAGLGEGPDEAYTIHTTENGIVRAAGMFTSDVGLTAFVSSSLAMALAFWVLPAQSRPVGRMLLVVSTASILMCLGLSGSRGAVLWSAVVMIGAFFGLFFVRPKMHFKATILIVTLVSGTAITLPVLFPQVTEAFVLRWIDAGRAESQAYGQGGVLARAAHESLLFCVLIPVTPPAGYGIGLAGNASWRLGLRDEVISFHSLDETNAAETDWGRNILEMGPILGCFFILFRISFVIRLVREALAATRRSGHSFPWLLCTYVAGMLFSGQITGNGTVNGYVWLFVGFCMAATLRARTFEEVFQ